MTTATESLVTFQTKSFEVEVNAASGALTLIDQATGRTWSPDPWNQTPGIVSLQTPQGARRDFLLNHSEQINVSKQGDSRIQIAYSGLKQANESIAGTFITSISADAEGSIRVTIESLEMPEGWALIEIEYPARFAALHTDVDAGYMVTPYLQGSIVPSTVRAWQTIPKLNPWSWDDGPWMEPGGSDIRIAGWTSCSLPFYGQVDGKSALMALVETENDASFRFVLNSNYQHIFSRKGELSPYQRIACASPLWLSEREKLGYKRSVLFISLPGGDYVSMAKRYRRYAKETGLLVTLREKIERTPELAKVIGALWINMEGGYPYYIDHPPFRYTWADAKKLVDDLHEYVGLKRAILTLWIGYQNLPPDNWPFHPAQGTLDELKNLVKYANSRDVLINFYHGYPALLDDAPNGDVARARRDRKGAMGQRWGRHCPEFYPKYAKKNLPNVVKDSGIVCEYSDILTAGTLGECWDERHPLTRTRDRELREETMEYVNSLGLFSGSEWPVPYAMPYLTYFRNGGAGSGGHLVLSQFPIPLLNLAFKDCAMLYGQYFPTADTGLLRDISAGSQLQATYWSLPDYYREGYFKTREGVKKCVPVFQDWNRQTGLEELVSHSWIEEWNGPYVTRFSDGSEALVNLTQDTREIEGVRVAPESAFFRFSDGRTLRAEPQQGWNLQTGRD